MKFLSLFRHCAFPAAQPTSEGARLACRHPFPVRNGRRQYSSGLPLPFFGVDTRVSRCYKPQKDKLFGGESPIELRRAVRE
jgi:hypothetical protein